MLFLKHMYAVIDPTSVIQECPDIYTQPLLRHFKCQLTITFLLNKSGEDTHYTIFTLNVCITCDLRPLTHPYTCMCTHDLFTTQTLHQN